MNPDLNCVGHPGTPIQVLIALISWLVYFVRQGESLLNDMLQNPESYIQISLYSIHLLNVVALFYLGKYAFRYTNSYVVALTLQLMPFMHTVVLECTGRLIPELIMPAIVSCWLIVLLKLIYEGENVDHKKYTLIFSLLFGFSFANKLTFLPFFLIPIIILPTWQYRLKFTFYSLFAFSIFAFPVLFNLRKFVRWVTGVFVHKGIYGSGDRGVIDGEVFIRNLKVLLTQTEMLIIPFSILLLLAIAFIIKQPKEKPVRQMPIRIFLALSAALLLQYMISAKHYALYYMTPSLLLSSFIIFLIFVFLGLLFPNAEKKKVITLILTVFCLGFVIYKVPQVVHGLKKRMIATQIKMKSYEQVSHLLYNSPKIICPYYYGCSSIEYALTFGLHESGRHSSFVYNEMKKLHPATYMYFPWGKVFYEGRNVVDPASFINTGQTYTLYIADYNPGRLEEILSSVRKSTTSYDLVVEELIQLPETAESVFSLRFISRASVDTLSQKVP